MKALTFSTFGGPEVLAYSDVPEPIIRKGEVLVKMDAIGLNFADIYRRKGNYHLKGNPPFINGYEGAGIITAIHESGSYYNLGDRVAFTDVPYANAEYVAVPEDNLIPLPENVTNEVAASVLLQGLTAQYLCEDSHQVRAGETIAIHAAAGGVGQILSQMCKIKGALVFGLTTRDAKKGIIIRNGAFKAINIKGDWKKEILDLTSGKGVDVVYDSVGSTLNDSLEITKICGHVVFFGMSGGNPDPVDPRVLMDGSKTLTGGDLWSYLTSKEERTKRANSLFSLVSSGKLHLTEVVKFKLSEGSEAHRYIESGQSSGKVLLIP